MPLVKLFKFTGSLGEIKCDLMLNSTNILYFIFYFYVKIKLINVNLKALLIKPTCIMLLQQAWLAQIMGGNMMYISSLSSQNLVSSIFAENEFLIAHETVNS